MKLHNVEQNTAEWDDLHIGRPTSCKFKLIITSKMVGSKSIEGYAKKLACDLYAGKLLDKWKGNKYTDRGHEVEQEAVNYYEFCREDTQKVGFVTDDEMQWGCSPDRFVGDDGLLEVKCFPESHFDILEGYKKYNKVPAGEVAQVQGQLFISLRKWCDLLYYHEHLPKLIIRVYPDLKFFIALARQLKECVALRDEYVNVLRSLNAKMMLDENGNRSIFDDVDD